MLPALLTLMTTSAPLHVVFLTGDEEYRSEESMPMLARILERELGVRTTVLYSLNDEGYIDPNRTDNIPGTDILKTADLLIVYTRFRNLPDHQLQPILDYVNAGKPVAGFRTATHAFRYEDPAKSHLNDTWPQNLFGQKWITHHGHFDDGQKPLTQVVPLPDQSDHPVLRGVTAFPAYSWLYHVHGNGHTLSGDSLPLVEGTALKSNHPEGFPRTNPVAWVKTHTAPGKPPARVFFTTLGHPYDFKDPSMRRLALNGLAWALGLEEKIPDSGLDPTYVTPYTPNNSGFGEKYKKNQKPPNPHQE